MLRVVTLVVLIAVAGCSRFDTGGTTNASPSGVAPTESTPTPSSPVTSPDATPDTVSAGERLSGVLGADTVEGGCGYLRARDGTRYEVVYPDGWKLSLNPLQLVAPDGEVVARAGDTVTVRGAVADDVRSICQVGPIFRAAEVVR